MLVLFQGDQHFAPPEDGSILPHLVNRLRREFEDKITEPQEQVEIDLWLESPGGDAHAAYKLAVLMRTHAHRVRTVVPDYAKSAATLLTLGSDEIFMAPASELGPLDAQIPNEGGIIAVISALDIARSLEDLMKTAIDMALRGGAEVLETTRLSRAESLSTMLTFSASFMEPLIRQLDPTMIHWSSTLLNVAEQYANRLLAMREDSDLVGQSQIPSLVENYPAHGFVITPKEAREHLRLPIRDLKTYPLAKEVSRLHREHEDSCTNIVGLFTPEELQELIGGSDE